MATIKDVAHRAGVSPSTVSYALSGKRPVSAAVRRRILDVIEELDYTPDTLARGLREGSSFAVGLVYPLGRSLPQVPGVDLIGAAAAALQERYTLSLYTADLAPADLLGALRQRRVDGLLLLQIRERDPRVDALRGSGHPFVPIGRPADARGLRLVDFDFEDAAYRGLRHLAELGHRAIGYLDFPAAQRREGLGYALYLQRGIERARDELAADGVELVRSESAPDVEGGHAATLELLGRAPHLSAIAAFAGTTHLGVLRALHDRGLMVPRDLSVIGLTSAAMAEWTLPRLTSIDSPLDRLGTLGAELLLERIAGDERPRQIILPARLVERESTAPPGR